MSESKIQKQETAAPAPAAELAQDRPVYVPATDIHEKPDALLVVCDMPGVDEKRVDVSLEDDVLTITGEQDARAPERHEALHQGYGTGVFRRSFTLTADIDTARIEAKLAHGVLRVVLPKSERAKPRRIAVQAGA